MAETVVKYKARKYEDIEMERPKVDSRLVRRMSRGSRLRPDGYIKDKEKARRFVLTSKWSVDERCVFNALADGYTTQEELEQVLDLTKARIKRALRNLEAKRITWASEE